MSQALTNEQVTWFNLNMNTFIIRTEPGRQHTAGQQRAAAAIRKAARAQGVKVAIRKGEGNLLVTVFPGK